MVSAGAHIMPSTGSQGCANCQSQSEGLGSMKWRISSGRWAPSLSGGPGSASGLARAPPQQGWRRQGQSERGAALLHGGVQPGFGGQRVTRWALQSGRRPQEALQFFFALSLAHFFPLSSIFSNTLLPPVSPLAVSPCFFSFDLSAWLPPSASYTHLPSLLSLFFLFPLPASPSPLIFLLLSPFFSHFFLVCVFLFPTLWPLSLSFFLFFLFVPSPFFLFASSLLSPFPFIIQAWQEVTWGWLAQMADPPALYSHLQNTFMIWSSHWPSDENVFEEIKAPKKFRDGPRPHRY